MTYPLNKTTVAMLVCVATLMSGCASAPKTPDWVNGASRQYSASQYLLGRGAASNAEQARERARADLAKNFQIAVSAESEDVQTFARGGSAAPGGSYEQRAVQRVVTRTEQIVRGVRIAELWQDPAAAGMHHALAVLPRLQAAGALREEIQQLDAGIRRHVQAARGAGDIFVQIGAASQAVELQAQREAEERSLRVVDPAGAGAPGEWSAVQLAADRDALLKRVRIAPRAAAGADPEADRILRGALAASGFVPQGADKSEFVLEGQLALVDLGLREGWHWQRGTISVTLVETESNRVRGTKSWGVRGTALNAAEARQRALQEADAVLKKELRGTLTGFATVR